MTLVADKNWGWSKDLTYANRLQLAHGKSRLTACDNGYSCLFSHYEVITWDIHVELLIKKDNETINECLKSRNIGPKKTRTNIENKHSGYLHMFYRYAIYTLGNKVSFVAIYIYKNQRSCINTKLREKNPFVTNLIYFYIITLSHFIYFVYFII